MKRRSLVLLVLCATLLLGTNSLAIGVWQDGKVTRAPWQAGKINYIAINGVRYTVMPIANVQSTYKSEGALQKEPLRLFAIRQGDALIFQVEGNRIYEIERTH